MIERQEVFKEKLLSLPYGVRRIEGGIGENKTRESLNLLLEPRETIYWGFVHESAVGTWGGIFSSVADLASLISVH